MSRPRYAVLDQNGDELAAFEVWGLAAGHLRQWAGEGTVVDHLDGSVQLEQYRDAEAIWDEEWDTVSRCPACGEPIDYCQGYGEIGDPAGFAVLEAHDAGDHSACHPEGCEGWSVGAVGAA